MKKFLFILAFILLLTNIPSATISSAAEGELLFELTDDEVDAFLTNKEGHKFLRPAERDGRPVYSKDLDGGIKMSGRDADWQSLDIRDDWMEDGKSYAIIVEFASSRETHFRIMNTDSPYASLAITGQQGTSGVLTLDIAKTDGQRGVRLTTPQTSLGDYTVRNIRIYEGELPADAIVQNWVMDIPSLHEAFSEHFLFGNILEPGEISNSGTTAMFIHQYNAVTAENAMKPESVWRTKNSYDFSAADRLVDWAVQNGITVHGHTLVWHSQSAPWLTSDNSGNPLTRAEAKANMELFISTYAGHFAGRVSSWDVVNEAIASYGQEHIRAWRNQLRTDSPWYRAYANGMDEAAGETPEDYIYDAFVFARIADPDATLYYNDYNEEFPHKRECIAKMVEELNAQWKDDPRNTEPERLLIEVIGMQAHYWTDALEVANVRDSIERFIETGARIAITELDIPLGTHQGFFQWSDSEIERQARLYASLFRTFVEYSEHIDRVTIWGKADSQSWRWEGHPVLFDGDFQPKPAFWSVVNVVTPAVEEEEPPVTPPDDEQTPAPPAPPTDQAPEQDSVPSPEPDKSSFNWWGVLLIGIGTAALVIGTYISVKKSKTKDT